ncbi:uncharacterized protein LOC114281830 [Camellia sinensis]|uniref:uncharacterized protein LOC114281830 n=1 Tax=Camellia sinensis TaxID=4442 RepID=UPI0010369714|nr:uncharacterized protein LOC114281830 [Camellia sinensis]
MRDVGRNFSPTSNSGRNQVKGQKLYKSQPTRSWSSNNGSRLPKAAKELCSLQRRDQEFDVGDHVFLKVTLMKGQSHFGKTGKLAPRYIGPFQILEKTGLVAYRLALPSRMEQIHNVFRISILRGYVRDPFHIIDYHQLAIDENFEYEEQLIQIVNCQVKQLRNKLIPLVKVEWKDHYVPGATWKRENEIKKRYMNLCPW